MEPNRHRHFSELFEETTRSQQRTRRLVWVDFLFVGLFMAIALYFFWPLMFNQKEPYAPISAVNELYAQMDEFQEVTFNSLVKLDDDSERFDVIFQQLKVNFPRREGEVKPLYWILIDTLKDDSLMMTQKSEVDFWEGIPTEILDGQIGFVSHSQSSKSILILIQEIPDTTINLALAMPYPPLFSR